MSARSGIRGFCWRKPGARFWCCRCGLISAGKHRWDLGRSGSNHSDNAEKKGPHNGMQSLDKRPDAAAQPHNSKGEDGTTANGEAGVRSPSGGVRRSSRLSDKAQQGDKIAKPTKGNAGEYDFRHLARRLGAESWKKSALMSLVLKKVGDNETSQVRPEQELDASPPANEVSPPAAVPDTAPVTGRSWDELYDVMPPRIQAGAKVNAVVPAT